MSEPPSPYTITLRDLRQGCPLLDVVAVFDGGLIGKNAAGEVVVRVTGKVTPRLIKQFRDVYQTAVAAGIIKRFTPIEQEPK